MGPPPPVQLDRHVGGVHHWELNDEWIGAWEWRRRGIVHREGLDARAGAAPGAFDLGVAKAHPQAERWWSGQNHGRDHLLDLAPFIRIEGLTWTKVALPALWVEKP